MSGSDGEAERQRLRGDLLTFSRRIAHDLRGPMSGVATASAALREMDSRLPAEQAILVKSLVDSSEEIVGVIERVSFALKATAAPQAKQPVAMKDMLWKALQMLRRPIESQGASIAQPVSWPQAEGVPSWLEVIWRNLISNSLKHAGPSPRIEVGWSAERGGGNRFWVRDDGRGVPAEKRRQLFHPFDRLHELDAPRGLGLPIVRRLVELQGGECGYEATNGAGPCFYFTLPGAGGPAAA